MASYLGPNVFVTGASRGLGLGFVKHLIGYPDVKQIFAGARTPNEATDLKDLARQSSKVKIVQFDSLSDESIKNAVKEVERAVGSDGLNLLVNNAGVFLSDGNNCSNPNREAALKVFNTNVVGVQITSAAFLPLLKKASRPEKRSKILNISSYGGSISRTNGYKYPHSNSAYPASKAALNLYTKFFATSEHARDEIIVVAICPGHVKTDLGGKNSAPLTVDESVSAVLKTMASVQPKHSGMFIDRCGQEMQY